MQKLNLVHAELGSELAVCPEVSFQIILEKRHLQVDFEVKASEYFVNQDLKAPCFGLWDWDVVEVFIQPDSKSPTYYEFQVSPLGQFFELEIFEPRKKVNYDYRSNGVFKSSLEKNIWSSSMQIEFDQSLENAVGNAFAILGKPRRYFSLFLPKQTVPDFHLPFFFRRFDQRKGDASGQ